MSERNFNPERRRFLKKAAKIGVAAVLGTEGARRLLNNNDNNKERVGKTDEEFFDVNKLNPQSTPLETKNIELPPYFLSESNVLEREVFGRSKEGKTDADDRLYQEWRRISKKERENLYQRRFGNQRVNLEKFFSRIIKDEKYRKKVSETVMSAAIEYKAPPALILGMIGVESGGNNEARSSSKPEARGILQLLPLAAREMGLRIDEKIDERMDMEKNINAGVRYLARLRNRFGSWGLALIAYCEGPTKLVDQICRNYPEIESQKSKYRRQDGNFYREFTSRGYGKFLQMVKGGKITIVHLYSRKFKGLGVIHPFQYPFYVEAMSEQMIEIMNNGRILAVPEIKESEKLSKKPLKF